MADNIISEKLQTEKPSDWQRLLNRGLFPAIGDGFSVVFAGIASSFWVVLAFFFGPRNRKEARGNDSLYLTATVISVIVSLFLAAISFYGSYTAAREYALGHGIAENVAGWIPVSVDGFIILAILVVFGSSLVGARSGGARFLVFAFTVISIVFNVAHITEQEATVWQHVLLGGIFPLVVFLSSEITSSQILAYIGRKSDLETKAALQVAIKSLASQRNSLAQEIEAERVRMLAEAQADTKAELEALKLQRDDLASGIEQAQRKLSRLKDEAENTINLDEKDAQVIYMLGADPDISGEKVGLFFGKSTTWGNTQKNKVRKLLDGVVEYVNS